MYAVVSSGGKQYRVEAGSELIVERIAGEPGAAVTFDRVLLVGDGDDVTVGTPTVSGASVSGTLLGEELGPKLVIFKFKQKVKYRRRTGHRQHLVRVRIDEINASGKRSVKAEAEPRADAQADASPAPAEAVKPARKPRAVSAKTSARATAKAAETAQAEAEPQASVEPAAEPEKPKRKPRATKSVKAEKPAEE
jgi:large subunit ribosomal protein L21